jgi:N-acyl-L-homoserine lactone synthetase
MIVSISGHERKSYSNLFRRLFQLRYDVFVGARQWTLPTQGNLDIDQYDCPDARYFFSMDDDGSIRSHVRVTPTNTHSLMADYFPHLVEGQHMPRGAKIYEATRYIVLPSNKSKQANKVAKAEILGAVIEWAYASGLTHVQTVIDTATLASFIEITPDCVPLGLSHPYGGGPLVRGGGEAIGIRCPATPKVISDIRAYGQWSEYDLSPAVNGHAA